MMPMDLGALYELAGCDEACRWSVEPFEDKLILRHHSPLADSEQCNMYVVLGLDELEDGSVSFAERVRRWLHETGG